MFCFTSVPSLPIVQYSTSSHLTNWIMREIPSLSVNDQVFYYSYCRLLSLTSVMRHAVSTFEFPTRLSHDSTHSDSRFDDVFNRERNLKKSWSHC